VQRSSQTARMHSHSANLPSDEAAFGQSQPPEIDKPLIRGLSFLDRFLALWILLAMVLGILLGYFVPGTQDVLNTSKLIGVSAPIGMMLLVLKLIFPTAVGLIVMMYPILCKVRYEELNLVFSERMIWKQLAFSFLVNWIVAPLVMVCI
jgi:arsenite transporter